MAKGVNYRFNRAADEALRSKMVPQFGADPSGGVVREGSFRARVDEQIRLRKAMEARMKKRRAVAAARTAG
jgi:hypothetical protein